jgi:hypothetical protein
VGKLHLYLFANSRPVASEDSGMQTVSVLITSPDLVRGSGQHEGRKAGGDRRRALESIF